MFHSFEFISELKQVAPIFAALGDKTRLRIIAQLGQSGAASIVCLTTGSGMTRQALTKHLHILAEAGLVKSIREGRERYWKLQTENLRVARQSLDLIAKQWDETLQRLKTWVEKE